jgi:hypothetical protein
MIDDSLDLFIYVKVLMMIDQLKHKNIQVFICNLWLTDMLSCSVC